MFSALDGLFKDFAEMLLAIALGTVLCTLSGFALAVGLRLRGLRWTWSAALLPVVLLLTWWSPFALLAGVSVCAIGCLIGAVWHSTDVIAGGDLAEIARERLGVLEAARRAADRWLGAREGRGWIHKGRLQVGRDARDRRVCVPVGERSGSHTLVLGATGSGKTCGQAWIAGRLIEHGHGAIAIDPKGDELLCEELRRAAERRGATFLCWTPDGPLAYNPFASGADGEIADKALVAETFSEPHYLRQAQRYLGHVVRTMRAARVRVTPASLMEHMDPDQLRATALAAPAETKVAAAVQAYLGALGERQRRELAGARDRLSILAESDVAQWLSAERTINLRTVVERRAVMYFRLDADRRPLLAQMLAGAIVADLVTLAAHMQADPIPTLVLIDEFSALGAERVGRLFGRGRSAGMSLLLGTQGLADLSSVGNGALRDQVIDNLQALVCYRQSAPGSAELIAQIAGTRPAWITSQRTAGRLLGHGFSGRGSRSRGHEPAVHPSRIQQLQTGEALVVTPGGDQPPVIARMHHPREAHEERRLSGALLSPRRAPARADGGALL